MNSSELFEVKRTPVPLWKWILLHFGKNYRNVDCEGDIVSVITAKYMFKVLWI